MPTYQYACTACHHQLEAAQSFTDDPLTQCPVCDGQLRKLFGSVGIVFKGPGFYRTDSRSTSNGKGNGTSNDSSGGDSSSTDTKPSSTDSKDSSSGSKEKKETTTASASASSK